MSYSAETVVRTQQAHACCSRSAERESGGPRILAAHDSCLWGERGSERRETENERAKERLCILPRLLFKMEVLQRALSTRSMGTAAAAKEDPLDASKHLEHIAEEQLDDRVTGSSVQAISSFLSSSQVCSCLPRQLLWFRCKRSIFPYEHDRQRCIESAHERERERATAACSGACARHARSSGRGTTDFAASTYSLGLETHAKCVGGIVARVALMSVFRSRSLPSRPSAAVSGDARTRGTGVQQRRQRRGVRNIFVIKSVLATMPPCLYLD